MRSCGWICGRRAWSSRMTAEAIVIGGGFYGCETALELKRLGFGRIVLVEREPGLLRRASFVNQARVHNGYHYPRAYMRKSTQQGSICGSRARHGSLLSMISEWI